MTTHTTNHLRLTWRDHTRRWIAQRDPIAVVGVLTCALIVVLSSLRSMLPSPSAAAAVPTAQLPLYIIATAPATQPPRAAAVAQAAAGHTLARAVVAYDSPDGKVIGAIDSGHTYRIVARFGADWIQADVTGSGVVWLRAADVFDLPQGLADLQPTALPQTVYVSAPAAPSYQVESAPAAQPTLTTDERQQALDREFGLTDDDWARAFAAQQAREAAWAVHQEDVPCHCP